MVVAGGVGAGHLGVAVEPFQVGEGVAALGRTPDPLLNTAG